jgi:hypothetical protein
MRTCAIIHPLHLELETALYSPYMLLRYIIKRFGWTVGSKSSEYQRGYFNGNADAQKRLPPSVSLNRATYTAKEGRP